MSVSATLASAPFVTLAKEVDPNKVTPGVLGFIVFAVLGLAVWGLMKSMNRHMGRIDFAAPPAPEADAPAEGAGAAPRQG